MPKINTEVKVGIKRTSGQAENNYANISNKKWIGVESLAERYKVVNCQRSQDTSSEEKSEEKWLTLIDVEDSWSVSIAAKQNAKETEVSHKNFCKNALIYAICTFFNKD